MMEETNRREKRRDGFIEVVEYYSYLTSDGRLLNEEQISQLTDARDHLYVFGETGQKWAGLADEIINEQNTKSYDERRI